MIYTVVEWGYYICCMVCMVCVGEWTFHWTVKDWKRFAVAGVIYVAGFACNVIQVDERIPLFLLFYIGEIISWTLICKGKLRLRLFRIMVIFYGVGIVEVGFRVLLEAALGDMVAKEVMNLVGILITTGTLAIVVRQRWYKKLINYLKALPKQGTVLILWAIIGGAVIISYGEMVQGIVGDNMMIWIFRVVLIFEMVMVVGIVIWLVMESNQKKYYLEQNSLKEEMLHIQQDYYKAIYEKDKEMRSFRHDVSSQLGLLRILLEKGDIEEAKEQLESVHMEFEQASFQKVHVGDEILDAILSMMKQNAVEKGIKLEIEGRIESEKKYDTYELCTIFSNAIKNASEACEKMGNKGTVSVKILEVNHKLYCTIENPATEEMYHMILKQETSKADLDSHGYGVGNIWRAVERLGGEMEYNYDDGRITLEIFI